MAVPGCQALFKLGGAGSHVSPSGAGHLHAQAQSQKQIRIFVGGCAQCCRVDAGFQLG